MIVHIQHMAGQKWCTKSKPKIPLINRKSINNHFVQMIFNSMVIGWIPGHPQSLQVAHNLRGIARPYLESWSGKISELSSENVADGYANVVTDSNTTFA